MLEFEVARGQLGAAFERRITAIETDLRVQLAARHTEAQRFKAQHTVVEHQVRVEVGERQLGALHNALAGELNIGVHVAPALSAELFNRQHLARRLFTRAATGLLLSIAVSPDQRPQVGHQQLVGHQLARQLGTRLAGGVFQITVNIAAADLAVEVFIDEHRPPRLMQLGNQMAISRVRWRVRQGHAG